MISPDFALRNGGGLGLVQIPTTVGVYERSNGDVVLVDVGMSRQEIDDPEFHFGPFRKYLFNVRESGAVCTAAQLSRRGINPESVTTIVATHLHADHVGGFVDFPNAEIVAPAAEFVGARKQGSIKGFLHVESILRSGRARPVLLEDGARFGFPHFLDLFGDGEVVLLDARGHTAGSVAVLITCPESGESVLMAGDAAYSPSEYRLGKKSPAMQFAGFRDEWIQQTWRNLAAFECNHPTTPIVLSHDMACFNHLPML